MANDGKIYITISDRRDGDGPGLPNNVQENEEKDKFSLATYAGTVLMKTLVNNTKKTVMYTINNIGNFTGNYRLQKDISEAIQLGESVLSIGRSFLAGTIVSGGNPIVGLIAAGADLIGQGVNLALQENSSLFAIKMQNYEIDKIRELSGLNTLKDGSRGTLD